MKSKHERDDAADLSELLRSARPEAPLPDGFRASVWRRIEQSEEATQSSPPWWVRLAWMWVEPRRAFATLALVSLLGAATGLVQGWQWSERLARDRYVTVVSPLSPWP